MELGTLGAVLAFAIRFEGQSAEFYQEAALMAKDSPAEEVFQSLGESKRKRKKRLEKSRREYVNEMLLEPIEGLNGNEYQTGSEPTSDMDFHAALRIATALEENSQRLYLDAAEKIGHLPQLARILRRLGRESADHALRLEPLAGSEVA